MSSTTPEKNSSAEEEVVNSNECCPICFISSILLITPCQHSACKPCFERLLLSTEDDTTPNPNNNESGNWEELQEDAIIASCPSRGRCPFCRRSIDMFQLKQKNSGPASSEQLKLVYRKDIDLQESPLCGLSYYNTRRAIGDHSIHFPPFGSPNNNCASQHENDMSLSTPVISFTSCARDERLDNGNPLPKYKHFESGYDYHASSRTFRGIIDWKKDELGSTYKGSHEWEVIMQFSSDFLNVPKGGILKHRTPDTYKAPLDGWWKVVGRRTYRRERRLETSIDFTNSDEDEPHVERVQVIDNSFYRNGERCDICLGTCVKPPSFTWNCGRYSQTVESGVDLQKKEDGPDIGGVIIWTTDHPDYHRFLWIRETIHNFIVIDRFGSDHQDSITYRRHLEVSQTKPVYNSESLWGNVFFQNQRIGLASFHFMPPQEDGSFYAYISYELSSWTARPLLDNGSPIPSRVSFVCQSFDTKNRTFCGKVSWIEDHNACLKGYNISHYEMVFDEEFTCIQSGKIVGETQDGTRDCTHVFGIDLNYINAALVERIGLEVDKTIQNNLSISRIHAIVRINRRLSTRLLEEGVSSRTLAQINLLVRGMFENNSN